MTEIDIEKYTTDVGLKNLVLVELHLASFSNAPLFCAECLKKHYLILEASSEECIGVCHINKTDVWHRLATWAMKAREDLPNLTQEHADKLKAETRDFRKELEALSGVGVAIAKPFGTAEDPEISTSGHLND